MSDRGRPCSINTVHIVHTTLACWQIFFWFCRTWTKRYLITSQTRVKRVSRIHHRTILAIAFLYLFLFHSLLCLTSFLSQYKNADKLLITCTRVVQYMYCSLNFRSQLRKRFGVHQSSSRVLCSPHKPCPQKFLESRTGVSRYTSRSILCGRIFP